MHQPQPGFTTAVYVLLIAGMLITGSANTLAKRVQNDATDIHGHPFAFVFTQVTLMFTGELLVMALYWYQRHQDLQEKADKIQIGFPRTITGLGPRSSFNQHEVSRNNSTLSDSSVDNTRLLSSDAGDPFLVDGDIVEEPVEETSIFIFLAPACCDVCGTYLGGTALLYIRASVWQMLRASIVVFTAIFSVLFLNRTLATREWTALGVVTYGLLIVALSAVLNPDAESDSDDASNHEHVSELLFGIACALAGTLFLAVQMIVEEKYLKGRKLKPSRVVAFEGFWGVSICLCLLLPIAYALPGSSYGSYENCFVAFRSIVASPTLIYACSAYVASIAIYNVCGLTVARYLSTVHRTLIDALRTVVVWAADLVIYYAISKDFGEQWVSASYIELLGFIFVVYGTCLYNRVDPMPCVPNVKTSFDIVWRCIVALGVTAGVFVYVLNDMGKL